MAKKLGIGIIGLGWAGCEHLKHLAQDSRVTPVAVCDINRKRAEEVAGQYDMPGIYTDVKDIVNDPAVDAVVVGTPNFAHAPTAIAALNAGKHVICEKPPALNAAEAKAAANAAKKNKCVLMYALCMRYAADAKYVRNMVDKGQLGDVYYGKCAYIRRSGIPIGADGWFVDKSRAGGGALIDIGVHALDVTWYMMGSPKPVSVSGASFRKFEHAVPKGVKFDVDDSSFGLIKFANGAALYVEATWAIHMPGASYFHVIGDKAGIKLEPLTIFKEENGSFVEITPHPAGKDGFDEEDKHFVDCILKKKTPISSAEEGVMLMQMLDGIYESARTGREVIIK